MSSVGDEKEDGSPEVEMVGPLEELLAEKEARHRQEIESLIEAHQRQTALLRSGEVGRLQELDDANRELTNELEVERGRANTLERDLRQANRRVELIYQSRTWRIGARIAQLLRPIRGGATTSPAPSPAAVKEKPLIEVAPPETHRPDPHPIAEEYRLEVGSIGVAQGVGIGFAVSTVGFDEGRGDLFVAGGLGRHLRRHGFSPVYLSEQDWSEMSGSLDWIVAMMPAFHPSRAPDGPRVVGWARNEVESWLRHDELELFDMILCSSSLVGQEIEKVYSGPVHVFPIGVDIELFEPNVSNADSRGGVVSTVNQWGRERDIYRALRSSPITFDLRIHGHAIGLPATLEKYHEGLVEFFELPSVYWGARIVLDDFNHTTVGWGAVNSRVFEALAAGALPITNSRLGLEELGLGDLPSYQDPSGLNPLVQRFLDDPSGTSSLVERLKLVVKERHSFDQRANELADILDRVSEEPVISRVVAFAPDYRESNPFQDMLYSETAKSHVAAFPVEVKEFVDGAALRGVRDRERVFHLHWTAPIIAYAATEPEALIRLDSFLKAIDSFKEEGGKFVWTIHNVMPHESTFHDLEVHLRQELADRADLVHVMCEATVDEIGDLYRLPPDRTLVLPHSSYIGVYPDAADRQLSRDRLGVDPEEVVVLALGGIRPYKGLDRLLEAFERAVRRERRLRLVVAGKTWPFPELDELSDGFRSHPRVIANFNEILAADLQHFYKASDVAVIPQRVVLNSGALLLAYTFGLPVIAPRSGCVAELLDDRASIGFDLEITESLEDALVAAPTLANPEARAAARAIADSRPIEEMSATFLNALDGIFQRRNP